MYVSHVCHLFFSQNIVIEEIEKKNTGDIYLFVSHLDGEIHQKYPKSLSFIHIYR